MRAFRLVFLGVCGLVAIGTAGAQTAVKPPLHSADELARLAQTPTVPLSTHVEVVSGDSLNMFYAADYRLAQPACATTRRQIRLDATGSFNSAFRDASWPGDSVELTGRYAHGQKEGLFTAYHANGQPEYQGHYRANRRMGEWKF